jgi:hypothetical protein
MKWLLRLYDRRIVNVNVNIIVAGMLAMGVTIAALKMLDDAGLIAYLSDGMPDLGIDAFGKEVTFDGHTLVVTGLTLVIDIAADLLVYSVLHWFANYMPRRKPRIANAAYADMSFVRDTTLIQFERATLSPLLYLITLGLQNRLLHVGWSIEAATFAGFTTGLAITRMMHTVWMLWQERRAGRRSAADIVGPDPMTVEMELAKLGGGSRQPAAGPDGSAPAERARA